MRLFTFCGLLGTLCYGQDDKAAWEQFETVDETAKLESIKNDIRNYQTIGICGTTGILPNEWIYMNKRRRRDTDNSTDATGLTGRTDIGRIVGGKEAKAHSWPWIVYLDFGKKFCGGTIIHPKYILTAVHCVHRESLPKIVAGVHDKTADNVVIGMAKKITLFPDFYKPVDWNNDIAIIELEEPLVFSKTIRAICLPARDSYINPDLPGTTCVAAGWGATDNKRDAFPNRLQEVNINLIDRKTCSSIPGYSNQVTDKMICAGHLEGGKDTCQGDSGGPLMCKLVGIGNPWILYGITSWGIGCAKAYTPGVYVKVSKFIEWIQSETGIGSGIDVSNYYNLDEVEPDVKPLVLDGKEEKPNYFAVNIQSEADTWEIQHHIQDQKVCGGELWGPEGKIQSDGYPYRYQPRQYCKWIIYARNPKNLIILKFKDIRLDSDFECFLNDHIMIFDYNNDIVGTPQCRLAKQTQWTVTGRRSLTVYFNTNDKTEGEGFLAEFYEREDPEKQHVESVKAARTCSDKWKLDASFSPQELTSPGWPNKYPLNTNCFWRIRAPTPSHIIHLQFKTVMMEDAEDNGKCKFDYIRLFRGTTDYDESAKLGELCGKISESKLEQTIYNGEPGESLYISFNSDNMGIGRGFRAFYIATKSADVIPAPTFSPEMKKYVLSNSKPVRPTGRPGIPSGTVGYTSGKKSKKRNKKNKVKGRSSRVKLWNLSRAQKYLIQSQDA